MTIKGDFYDIVKVHDDGLIQEYINDGIKTYLEKLGFNTDVIDFNIVIEMQVDSDRIKNYKRDADLFLNSYCDLLATEIDSSVNDEELIANYQAELEVVTEFLNDYE